MTSPQKTSNNNAIGSSTECVKVALRCRPMNRKEKERGTYFPNFKIQVVDQWFRQTPNSVK